MSVNVIYHQRIVVRILLLLAQIFGRLGKLDEESMKELLHLRNHLQVSMDREVT